jgi:DNA repair protein RadD
VTPRGRQEEFIGEIRSSFARFRRVLFVAPTGFGKTFVFAYIAWLAAQKGSRVVIVAHRIEICDQICLALSRLGVRHGRIMQGHTLTDDQIQVGMIQTVARRIEKLPEPHLLVIDEAHHAVAGTWQKVAAAWSRSRQLGVTASPLRLDGRGLGAAFEHMIVGPAPAELIEAGWLAGFQYLAPPQQADLSSIGSRAGDYAIDELEDAMDRAIITGDAVSHYQKHLAGRPAIAFCVTVAHAEHVAQQFNQAGIRAASVDGAMDKSVRRDRIAAIGDGRLDVLTSCDLISEGTDIPSVAGAILLRPTKSLAMFLQQCGRVLRIKPDGSKAIILDHVGSVHRHGLPDEPRDWSLDAKKKKPKAPSVRTCTTCFRSFNALTAREDAAGCETENCPILAVREKEPHEVEVVPGELHAVTADDLAHLRAGRLRDVLRGNETLAELQQIAKARGYKLGWAWRTFSERRKVAA